MATFNTERSIDEILRNAQEHKLELYSLQHYHLNKETVYQKPTFILGFTSLPVEKIEEGVDRMYRAVYT